MLSQSRERITAIRLRIFGTTDAHAELSRDLEQVRHEAISIANECGNGLFWVERVQVATSPRLDREELLKRDDPIGEILRIIAALRHGSCELGELGHHSRTTEETSGRSRGWRGIFED